MREKLVDLIKQIVIPFWAGQIADHLISNDVVLVVRCKDCKHWMDFPNCGCTEFVKVCALAEYRIGANGYCLYGERKDGDAHAKTPNP